LTLTFDLENYIRIFEKKENCLKLENYRSDFAAVLYGDVPQLVLWKAVRDGEFTWQRAVRARVGRSLIILSVVLSERFLNINSNKLQGWSRGGKAGFV